MTNQELILFSEQKYDNAITQAVSQILNRKTVRLILVAGPSCSGKTTTTAKLVELLSRAGIRSHMISIDDFYTDVETLPGGVFGNNRDFEAIESIDLDLLHSCLKNLADGKCAQIPLFDFEKARRDGIRERITLKSNEIAIIEGLHALNPAIYKNFVDDGKIFRIFLDCRREDVTEEYVKYPRLIRRLVRDSRFRNADAEKTFYLWKNVVAGEEKYIFPFSRLADVCINTFFEYETAVLKPFAQGLTDEIPKGGDYEKNGEDVKAYLELEKSYIPPEEVPKSSMLREFIG